MAAHHAPTTLISPISLAVCAHDLGNLRIYWAHSGLARDEVAL